MVLCHATGLHGGVFEPLLGHLSRLCDEIRVPVEAIVLDFHNHGFSAVRGSNPLDWGKGCVQDLHEIVLGHERTLPRMIVGHSMGGAAAALAAMEFPTTIDSLVLFEPVLSPVRERARKQRVQMLQGVPGAVLLDNALAEMTRRRRSEFPSLEVAAERLRGRGSFAGWEEAAFQGYLSRAFVSRSDRTAHNSQWEHDTLEALRHSRHHWNASHDEWTAEQWARQPDTLMSSPPMTKLDIAERGLLNSGAVGPVKLRCVPNVESCMYRGGNEGWSAFPKFLQSSRHIHAHVVMGGGDGMMAAEYLDGAPGDMVAASRAFAAQMGVFERASEVEQGRVLYSPDGRYSMELLPRLGHFLLLEDSAACAAIVVDRLQRLLR
jgi:pimeloyl-ACP methyl ester carboxylesterase